MKLKNGFVLREVAGETIVVPGGDALDLNMMITLNDTGRFLWQRLETGAEAEELVDALLDEYDVSPDLARQAVDSFIARMRELDFLA